ncbi:hypothetical protein EYF80_067033 [Liparis tanakae]|uniref:Uncharacterized protein n=1 Tax=Liparis tanakae TaxID=230148 RepID=A0A4Z2E273_9TELE|nr:hypothetical protein EYF80_067033 [Liparis tanakae]
MARKNTGRHDGRPEAPERSTMKPINTNKLPGAAWRGPVRRHPGVPHHAESTVITKIKHGVGFLLKM